MFEKINTTSTAQGTTHNLPTQLGLGVNRDRLMRLCRRTNPRYIGGAQTNDRKQ